MLLYLYLNNILHLQHGFHPMSFRWIIQFGPSLSATSKTTQIKLHRGKLGNLLSVDVNIVRLEQWCDASHKNYCWSLMLMRLVAKHNAVYTGCIKKNVPNTKSLLNWIFAKLRIPTATVFRVVHARINQFECSDSDMESSHIFPVKTCTVCYNPIGN